MDKIDSYLYDHPKALTVLAVVSFLGGVGLGVYHSLRHRKNKGGK